MRSPVLGEGSAAPGKVQKVRVLGVCGTGEKVTSLCWQRVPDTTQLPAWRAGSPGSESPAHPLIPETAWLSLGEGRPGWLGEGSSSTSPPDVLPPRPGLPHDPGLCLRPEEPHGIGAVAN